MAASNAAIPLTPISALTRMLPPLEGAPELEALVGVEVLSAPADVAAAVLVAAAELVLAGTSVALRVPHVMQASEPGFWIRHAAKRSWH